MRNKITYITKIEFLLCFIAAYKASITRSNILRGFLGASLGLFNLEVIILTLNVYLYTLLLLTIKDSP